jgi:hypothetical protein
LHGTHIIKDRIYTEDTFYGRGKAIREATKEELKNYLQGRKPEDPQTHSNKKES